MKIALEITLLVGSTLLMAAPFILYFAGLV